MKLNRILGLILAMALVLTGIGLKSYFTRSNELNVGILQLVTHDALDKATEGFKEALLEEKPDDIEIKFVYKNPEADEVQKLAMAKQLVTSCDIVMGNATPAALALKAATITEGKDNLPVLFTSVTDPVDAKLIKDMDAPGGNCTGTSDLNPISKQMDMIYDYNNSIQKIGFIYNISETNSKTQCDEAINYVENNQSFKNTRCIVKTVSEQSQIASTVSTLINEGVEAIYVPTDNLMAANMTILSNQINEAKEFVPLFCGESSMVDNGGTFSISISYKELGRMTGRMAAKILYDGEKPKNIPCEIQSDVSKFETSFNSDAIAMMEAKGHPLSKSFKEKYNIQ